MAADVLRLKVTATDKDDDFIDRFVDLGSVIRFEDDGPSGIISLSGVTLNTDETAGVNDLQNGDSETAPVDDTYGQALGRSVRTYGELVTDGILFGSDGAKELASKTFALVVTDGTASGYTAPDGLATILLYNKPGVIEGRVGGETGNVAFTITVNSSSGEVTLSQYLAVRHSPNTNDDQLSSGMAADVLRLKVTATDKDDDFIDRFVDLGSVIRFEDDGPSITTDPTADADPAITLDTWTYSAKFAYSIGSDRRGAYSGINSDFKDIALSGNANGVAVTTPLLTWISEDNTQATFGVSFGYDDDRNLLTTSKPINGTLVFDKVFGSYTFQIDALTTKQSFTLAEGTGYEGYPAGSTSPGNGPQPVATGQLGDDFFIQITGFNQPLQAGGDKQFSTGELISGKPDSVTLSSTALGVSGNTIQAGEAANIQFFGTNPGGVLGNPDNMYVSQYISDFYLKFDGYETEDDDLLVVLGLVRLDGDGAIVATTTKAIYVDQGDAFEDDDYANLIGTSYEQIVTDDPLSATDSFLDNNDALLIIESNDYNLTSGESWLIKTVQILSSPDGITGGAINLNRNVGENGFSKTTADPLTGLIGPGNTIAEDSSTNPIKIIDAGFTSAESTPPSLDLTLKFAIVDADGDTTAQQSIDFDYGMTALSANPNPEQALADPFSTGGTYPLASPTDPFVV
jgi:hypothetical protein